MSAKETDVNPNKALWEKGDFTRIAAAMRESGEALAGSLGITPGLDVLDLGCGDGTTAVPEAQLGAHVLGVDIARNLVAAGKLYPTEVRPGFRGIGFEADRALEGVFRFTAATSPIQDESKVEPGGV